MSIPAPFSLGPVGQKWSIDPAVKGVFSEREGDFTPFTSSISDLNGRLCGEDQESRKVRSGTFS